MYLASANTIVTKQPSHPAAPFAHFVLPGVPSTDETTSPAAVEISCEFNPFN